MRNSECGMRNRSGMSRDTIPTLTFRIPHSAFRILFLVAACTPITTRPDFRPDPRALTVVLDARPERVTTVLDSLVVTRSGRASRTTVDRKSTRLNSSHDQISYAVFCLKKKKKTY